MGTIWMYIAALLGQLVEYFWMFFTGRVLVGLRLKFKL